MIITICHVQEGLPSIMVDDYFSWDEATDYANGYLFWFDDHSFAQTYFVPVAGQETPSCRRDSLSEAFDSWLDWLFDANDHHLIGAGYEGSQSFEDYEKEMEMPLEEAMNSLSFGASYYAVDRESWQCREARLNVCGLEYGTCVVCGKSVYRRPSDGLNYYDDAFCGTVCRDDCQIGVSTDE